MQPGQEHFIPRVEFVQTMAFLWAMGIAALALIWSHLRSQRKQKRLEIIHQERMLAMEKGIPLPELPAFPEEGRPREELIRPNPRWALGVGVIFIMLGAGVSTAYYLAGDAGLAADVQVARVWPFGLIGVFLGWGFVFHYLLTQRPGR